MSAALQLGTNSYRLCYVRGPAGIVIELAEQIELASKGRIAEIR